MMSNEDIMNDVTSYQIVGIIKEMSDNGKKQLLHNQEFIEKYQISGYELKSIVSSLTDEAKVEVLMDIDLIKNQLDFEDFKIVDLVKELSSEEAKDKIIEIYQFTNYQKTDILETCSNSYKLDVLLKEKSFNKINIFNILQTLDANILSEFLVEHKEFCSENGISPYEIINKLDTKQQEEFLVNLENINLTLSEKREILATLKTDVKQSIDITNFPEEYKSALSVQTTEYDGKVILDFEKNLEDYRGLDSLISINPEKFTKKQRIKFIELCDICPNLEVRSNLNDTVTFYSTATEYKEAEEWINSIIDNLNSKYSKAQKMAVIDNAIGKKISYSPDFDTEVFNSADCRALWKVISSGYGVCNGLAKVEQYMLNRIGIQSELVSSDTHTFLKIKDMEFPLANGKIARGNTILDPTWNLTNHRFGGKPDNFCISNEQARKTKTETKAGGKLDSIADLVFGIVIIKVLYPIIISKRIWIVCIIIIFLVRLISIFIVLKKYKTFAILHTYLNKIAGVLIFLLPYFIFIKYENVFINLSYIIATLSSIEEMCINLKSKSINQNKKSIVIK